MRSWLVESLFATEEGYPRRIEYNSLDILSGRAGLPSEPCIFRGSIGSAKQLSRQQAGNIALFLGNRPDSFDFGSFSKEILPYALNRIFFMAPLWYFKEVHKKGVGKPLFLRPNSGWKPFAGQIIKNVEQLNKFECADSTICAMAARQYIETEYRFVVVGRTVVSGSQYQPDEAIGKPEAYFFAQKVVDAIAEPPDLVYTVDVCQLDDGTWRAIELNSFSCSGLYQCEIEKVCYHVEAALENEDTGHDSDIGTCLSTVDTENPKP